MAINEIIVLILFIAAVSSIYIGEAVQLSAYAYNKLRARYRRMTKRALLLHALALAGIILFCYGYFIEPYRIEVKTIPIKTSKLSDATFRIVQISDLHCDKRPGNEKHVVNIINSLEPDVIVFTGDAVNKPSWLPKFKETMKSLKASLGKFAVYGNWETRHWPGLDYYSQTGFDLLDGDVVRLEKNGETITISGLSCDTRKSARSMLNKLTQENYDIFLYHYSDLIESLEGFNVDLYLCGHTHGGQVALPFYGALITLSKFGKKYESGQYTVGNATLYVNRGLGMDAYPLKIRLFARPEITVFDIGPE
jgi:predicted MPP superfamily phosphohydrolase